MRIAVWPGHIGKRIPDPGACCPVTCEATASGYPRAHALLALTRAPAVLLELADVSDVDAVASLRTHPELVGRAVVAALAGL